MKHAAKKLSNIGGKHSLKNTSHISRVNLTVFGLVFAAIGAYFLLHSFAATSNANLWIDTNGGTCNRQATATAYNDDAACSSFTAAYNAASAGDTIYVKAGTYGNQTVPARSIGASVVTISAAPDETVNTGDIEEDSSYVTINGFNVGNNVINAGGSSCNRTGVTFSNNTLSGVGAAIKGSCGNVTVIGNDISGTNQCVAGGEEDAIQFYGFGNFGAVIPSNITVKNNYIHDMATAAGQCGAHADGLQAFGCKDCIIDGNRWDKTDTSFIIIYSPNTQAADVQNITVQNNSFGSVKEPGHGVSIGGQPCTTSSNVIVQNNTFLSGDTLDVNCTTSTNAATVRNNIFLGGDQYSLCSAYPYSMDYNVFNTSITGCGAHKKNCIPTFVDANHTNGNIDLAASDTCAKDYVPATGGTYPSTDINGTARPQGAAVDAGADEYNNPCTQTLSVGDNVSSAVTNAANGSTICLNDGNYGQVQFNDISRSGFVTLVSVNAASATINPWLWNSDYIKFQNLTLNGGLLRNCNTHIHFIDSNFTGGLLITNNDWTCPAGSQDYLIDGSSFNNVGQATYEGRLSIVAAEGIVVKNSSFTGVGAEASDGIQISGGTKNSTIGPNNTFSGILESQCGAVHCDAIQLVGAGANNTITGNYFKNGDTFIMAPDGSSSTTIINNVFDGNGVTYPDKIQFGTASSPIFRHNTVRDVRVSFDSKTGSPASTNVLAQDNIMIGSSTWKTSNGSGCSNCTFTSNLFDNSGDATGTNNIIGVPTFTGGASPSNYAEFALTTSSIGHNAASDGTDMGADVSGGDGSTAPTFPTVTFNANPTTVTTGNSSTLTWSSTDATSCTASGAWSGSKAISGSQSVSPSSSSTYTLTCTGAGGSSQASATVTVTIPGDLTIGETNVLGTGDSGNGNLLSSMSATLSQTATIKSMSFYVSNAAGKLRLGIYDATGPSGGPGALKAQTAEITPVTGWNTANVTNQVSLSPGTYWLAFLASDSNLGFVKTTDTNGTSRAYSYTYGPLPSTFSTSPTFFASRKSLYATLNTGSGGGAVLGDCNNDGHVTITDLSILLSHYNTNYSAADFDTNGIINITDLSILLSHFGT